MFFFHTVAVVGVAQGNMRSRVGWVNADGNGWGLREKSLLSESLASVAAHSVREVEMAQQSRLCMKKQGRRETRERENVFVFVVSSFVWVEVC